MRVLITGKDFPENYPAVFFVLVVVISVSLIFGIMAASNYINMKSCLSNDAPRRWHNGICEEYRDNEWLQISQLGNSKIHYNQTSKEIIKQSRGD